LILIKGLKTRIQYVSSFLEYINSKFIEHFIPGKNIRIDESIIKFKEKICFIIYNPNKSTKWSIRIYVLMNSETEHAYIILLGYYESITSENLIRLDLPVSSLIEQNHITKLHNEIM